MNYFYAILLSFSLWTILLPRDWFANDKWLLDEMLEVKNRSYMRPYKYLNDGIDGNNFAYFKPTDPIQKNLKRLLEKSVPRSRFYLGCIYQLGLGVEIDYKKAIDFYEKSLCENYNYYPECLNNLGVIYLQLKNFELAQKCLFVAAIQGSTHAIRNLADLYKEKGDEKIEFWLLEILAEKTKQSHDIKIIGEMYKNGVGTAKDIAWSEKCLQLYEQRKNHESQFAGYQLDWPILVIQNKVIDISRIAGPWCY